MVALETANPGTTKRGRVSQRRMRREPPHIYEFRSREHGVSYAFERRVIPANPCVSESRNTAPQDWRPLSRQACSGFRTRGAGPTFAQMRRRPPPLRLPAARPVAPKIGSCAAAASFPGRHPPRCSRAIVLLVAPPCANLLGSRAIRARPMTGPNGVWRIDFNGHVRTGDSLPFFRAFQATSHVGSSVAHSAPSTIRTAQHENAVDRRHNVRETYAAQRGPAPRLGPLLCTQAGLTGRLWSTAVGCAQVGAMAFLLIIH